MQHQVGDEDHNWELVGGNPTGELEGQKEKKVAEEEWGVGCRKGGEERAVKVNSETAARGHMISASYVTFEMTLPT